MNYRLLGPSGLRVSELALGTMTFGEDWGWGSAKEEARKIYERFREDGGNFIDTANVYTNGQSETFVGEFLEGHRSEIVLTTKYTSAAAGADANAGGNGRKTMMQAVEQSLKRLRTDYIDLYWMHAWDQITPVEEVMRAFDDLVRQGKVLYVGVSDAPAHWIAQANTIAAFRGWSPAIALQIEYSLIERTVERDLIPAARALGMTVVAWSPLSGGVLSGKYDETKSDADSRYSTEAMQGFMPDKERQKRIVEALRAVAHQCGRSLPQVALAWLRYRSVPVIPIIGARKLAQFEDNLASLTLELSPEQVKALDEASYVDMGFLHNFLRVPMVSSFVSGGLADRIIR